MKVSFRERQEKMLTHRIGIAMLDRCVNAILHFKSLDLIRQQMNFYFFSPGIIRVFSSSLIVEFVGEQNVTPNGITLCIDEVAGIPLIEFVILGEYTNPM